MEASSMFVQIILVMKGESETLSIHKSMNSSKHLNEIRDLFLLWVGFSGSGFLLYIYIHPTYTIRIRDQSNNNK
jgi:hypothetical protein